MNDEMAVHELKSFLANIAGYSIFMKEISFLNLANPIFQLFPLAQKNKKNFTP